MHVFTPHWIALGGWIVGWILLWRVPRLPRRAPESPMGPVTIIIPARNEAQRLPGLLGPLTDGLSDVAKIVVVDDHSTDGTGEVAATLPRRARIVRPGSARGVDGEDVGLPHGRANRRAGGSRLPGRGRRDAPRSARARPGDAQGARRARLGLALPSRGARLRALERPLQRDDVHGDGRRQPVSSAKPARGGGPDDRDDHGGLRARGRARSGARRRRRGSAARASLCGIRVPRGSPRREARTSPSGCTARDCFRSCAAA